MTAPRGKAKYTHFVVYVGRTPGVYETWAETQEQVSGFSGNRHKGFTSYAEAKASYKAFSKGKLQSPLTAKGPLTLSDSETSRATSPAGTPVNNAKSPVKRTRSSSKEECKRVKK